MNTLTFSLLRRLADGEFHSGEAMARDFAVSRGSVWNALRGLEGCGITIFKIRGRGYRWAEPTALLDAGEIARGLGKFASRYLITVLDRVDSTNSFLMQQAAENAASGQVIATEWQTQGRGRQGRSWHALPGAALTFSVLWRFQQGVSGLAGLSLTVGIAIVRALRVLGVREAGLKWPNDIWWRGAKIAGVLVEVHGDVLGPSAAVIGIGINCRMPDALRTHIDQPVADLQSACGLVPDRNGLLAAVLIELARVLDVFEHDGFAAMRDEWQGDHLFQRKQVKLELPSGDVVHGLVQGVAEDGALLLLTDHGIRRYYGGEVSMRPETVCVVGDAGKHLVGNKVIAIDAGNTRTKWGLHDGIGWARLGWFSTSEPHGLATALSDLPAADAIVISHVADPVSRERFRLALPPQPAPHWITSVGFQCGVRNHYDDPGQLGCDRWAALIGARRQYRGAALVVNAGTALTVDALTEEGHFIGGIIAPGLMVMHRALARNTAALPLQSGEYSAFPVRTADAITSGTLTMLCGAVERMARLLRDAGHVNPLCLVSGGDAHQIVPLLNLEVKVVDNLVLEGLLGIAWDDLKA